MGILLILTIVSIVKIYYLFYIGFALEQAYGIYTGITLLIYIISEVFFLRNSLTFFKINSILFVIVGIATMTLYLHASLLRIMMPMSLIIIYIGLILNVRRTVAKHNKKVNTEELNKDLPKFIKSATFIKSYNKDKK